MHGPSLGRLLIVDDEIELLNSLADKLAKQGYETVRFSAPEDALRALQNQTFDLLLTDLMMPGMDGIALLRAARQLDPYLTGIVMTGQATVQTAVDALKTGALDYVLKPFTISTILPALARALESRRLRLENIQLRETAGIYELCNAIAFTLDHQTLLHKVVDAALQQCEAEEASVMLPTEGGDELLVAAVRGEGRGHLLGERIPVNLGIAGWVARHHEPVAIAGEVADPRFEPVYPRPDIRCAISAPMIVGGRLVGVLNVHSTTRHHPFTMGQVKALNILAGTGAAALENAHLHLAIRRAEENYRSIFENASEGILRSTREGRVLITNPALARMLGYDSPEEFVATVHDLGTQVYRRREDRDEIVRRLTEAGSVQNAEVEMVRKDGGRIWVALNCHAVRDARGEVARFDSTFGDITHRKLTEKLSSIEHRVAKALAGAPALPEALSEILRALGEGLGQDWCAVWRIDPQAQVLHCTEAWHPRTESAAAFERFSRTLTFERGSGLPGRVWATGEPAWTPDVAKELDFRRAAAAGEADYHGALAFPLLLDGTALGVIELFSRETREPGPALLWTLSTIGRQVGQFIEKRRAEEARALFRALIDRATDVIEVIDPDTGRFLDVNETACQFHGYTRAEYLARSVPDINPRVTSAIWTELVEEWRRGGGQIFEGVHRRMDGSLFPVEISVNFVTVDREYLIAVVRDVTERKREEESLKESEGRYRQLFESNPHPMWVFDAETLRFLAVNDAAVDRYGYSRDEFLGMTIRDIRPPEDAAVLADELRTSTPALQPGRVWRHRWKDGNVRDVEVASHAFAFGGRPARLVLATDVTARKRAEEGLRAERDRFTRVAAMAPGAVYSFLMAQDGTWSLPYASPGIEDIYGLRPEDVADDVAPLLARVHPDDRDRMLAANAEAARTMSVWRSEFRVRHPVKGELWVEGRSAPSAEPDGGILWHGVLTDITHRKRAEERLRHVVTSSPAVLFTLIIAEGQIRGISWISSNVGDMLGFPPEAAADPEWWLGNIHPEDRDRVIAQTQADLFERGHTTHEYRFRRSDGKYLWTRGDIRLIRDPAGRPVEAIGSWSDVTDRRHIEDQLRQAQKMEVVGQLAGGVAHDFNNLLTVINGYSDIALDQLPHAHPVREMIQEVRRSGDRAAGLTRQLLAFSRQQVLEPRVIDLSEAVRDAGRMLHRLIGEDVELTTALAPAPVRVKADPGQVEQVVLNLAVNARDAMSTGGKLTIETAEVELDEAAATTLPDVRPGRYALLAVSDTGHGMTDEVKAQIFEPFFTTKEAGKGTGLGLSTVWGIVRQSGGHVEVYSEPGRGTAFKVYLPATREAADGGKRHAAHREGGRGSETILLVEDEPAVRQLARLALTSAGYRVLEAGHPEEAIELARRHHGPIPLLVTDVIMPGMGGREVSDRLAQLRPGIKVLYLSGYTPDAVVRHGVLQADVAFLQKPFAVRALTEKVREVLDAPGPHSQGDAPRRRVFGH